MALSTDRCLDLLSSLPEFTHLAPLPVSGSGIDASSGRFSVRSWESESPGLLAAVAVAADFERDDVPKKSTFGSDSAAFGPRREPAGVRVVDPPPLWLEALLVRRERARRKRPKRLVVDFADAEVSNSSAAAWAAAPPPPSMTRATVVAGLLGRTASFPNRKTEAFERGNGPWRKGLRSFLPVSSDGKSGSTNFLGRESLVLPCPFALPRLSTPLPHSSLARAENRAPPPSLSPSQGEGPCGEEPLCCCSAASAPLCCFCSSILPLSRRGSSRRRPRPRLPPPPPRKKPPQRRRLRSSRRRRSLPFLCCSPPQTRSLLWSPPRERRKAISKEKKKKTKKKVSSSPSAETAVSTEKLL